MLGVQKTYYRYKGTCFKCDGFIVSYSYNPNHKAYRDICTNCNEIVDVKPICLEEVK